MSYHPLKVVKDKKTKLLSSIIRSDEDFPSPLSINEIQQIKESSILRSPALKLTINDFRKMCQNKDKSTNVLTFPYNDDNHFSGDIVLCPEVINKEAKKFGFSSDLRWAHMIIHSMLHLQGYDHKTKRERMNMENMEVKLLAHMNYGDPYVRR